MGSFEAFFLTSVEGRVFVGMCVCLCAICVSAVGHIGCEVKQGDSLIGLKIKVSLVRHYGCFISLLRPRLPVT